MHSRSEFNANRALSGRVTVKVKQTHIPGFIPYPKATKEFIKNRKNGQS